MHYIIVLLGLSCELKLINIICDPLRKGIFYYITLSLVHTSEISTSISTNARHMHAHKRLGS